MGQPKLHSFIESCMNTSSGFVLGYVSNILLFPLFGIHISVAATFWYTMILTVISVVRGYVWRRIFNHRQVQNNQRMTTL